MARPAHVRNAVAELVAATNRHDWSIEEVTDELAAQGTSADFSTIYRAIEALVASGALRRVQLGTRESRFEAASEPHAHIRCEHCGAIGEVPNSTIAKIVPEVERVTQFTVTGHEVLFRGLCAACARSDPRPAPDRSV